MLRGVCRPFGFELNFWLCVCIFIFFWSKVSIP